MTKKILEYKEVVIIIVLEAIQVLKNGKAPEIESTSSELVKHGEEELAQQLTHLFNMAWDSENVPEDWRKGMTV